MASVRRTVCAVAIIFTLHNGKSVADNTFRIMGGCGVFDHACQNLMIKQAGKAEEEARQIFLQNKLLEQQLLQSQQQQSNSEQIRAIQLENQQLREQIQLLIQQQQQLLNSAAQRQTGTDNNLNPQPTNKHINPDTAIEPALTEADVLKRTVATLKCKSAQINLLSSNHSVNLKTSRYKVVCSNRSDLVVECRAETSKPPTCYKIN